MQSNQAQPQELRLQSVKDPRCMIGDVCYPLASPSGSLKWAELFSYDLTLSQALMVMSNSLLGLSPQL